MKWLRKIIAAEVSKLETKLQDFVRAEMAKLRQEAAKVKEMAAGASDHWRAEKETLDADHSLKVVK